MKQETLKLLENNSAALTIGTGVTTSVTKELGWLEYLDFHAAGIGVLLTVFFGVGYLIFHYLSLKKQSLADENKRQIELIKAKQARDMDSVKGILKSIESEMIKSNQKAIKINKGK